PLVRAARRDRVPLRRRGARRLPGRPPGRRRSGAGPLHLLPRQPEGPLPGAVGTPAALAAGGWLQSTSTVHGRPRGIMSAGAEEASALVQVEAPWSEPLVAAPAVE